MATGASEVARFKLGDDAAESEPAAPTLTAPATGCVQPIILRLSAKRASPRVAGRKPQQFSASARNGKVAATAVDGWQEF